MRKSWLRRVAALGAVALISGILSVVAFVGAAHASSDCPIVDVENATTCEINAAHVVPTGTYVFHKNVQIDATGSISVVAAPLTLNIDGATGGTGAFTMKAGASVVDTSDTSNANAAGALTINATGAGTLETGSTISAENNVGSGDGGPITLSFGASSTFAGTISSRANAGTTSNNGGDIKVTVTGDLEMLPGSVITSQKHADSGKSGDIDVTVSGNMTMDATSGATAGALITAGHPGGTNLSPAGNITILVGNVDPNATPPIKLPPLGTFTMGTGSQVDANSAGLAGDIKILAGHDGEIDGNVLSESTLSGNSSNEAGGGPITIQTGCGLKESDTGLISSKGQDQGADLVHLESCEVTIDGVVQSTVINGGGHSTTNNKCNAPNYPYQHTVDGVTGFSGCVEIWGQDVTIDASGAHHGSVNVDNIRTDTSGAKGGWIDIMSFKNTVLAGDAANNEWTLSAQAHDAQGNQHGGLIRVFAGGSITASGPVARANITGDNGNTAGEVDFFANGSGSPAGDVALGTDSLLEANADGVGIGTGGLINVQSYNGKVTGTTPGHIDAHGQPAGGTIHITDCLNGGYSGTTNPVTAPVTGVCGSPSPFFPANVTTAFGLDGVIWAACQAGPSVSKSGLKWNDLNGNGVRDPGEPGIAGWPIHITVGGVDISGSPFLTDASGFYSVMLTSTPGGSTTYLVCEGVGPIPGMVQTAPNASTTDPNPPSDTVALGACPAPNVNGYRVIVDANTPQALSGDDFGNFIPPAQQCPEDPTSAAKLTRIVDPSKPLGGAGTPGHPANYATVQAAYDAAKGSAQTEVIGLFSKTTENVVMDGNKSITITQCTNAQITALDPSKPVIQITDTKPLTIISPDTVGGTIGWDLVTGGHTLKSIRANNATVAGVRIEAASNSNKVSWNRIDNNAIGIDVLGGSNTLTGGSLTGNTGVGVHLGGTKNTMSGATIQLSGGHGVLVDGSTSTIKSNKSNSNAGFGFFNSAGSGNNYAGNTANTNAKAYVFTTAGVNGNGNKDNGTSVPSSTKGCSSFNAGQTCN
jgi:hypothetical protein